MKICKIENCGRKLFSKEFCEKHWKRFKKTGNPYESGRVKKFCTFESCDRKHYGLGYCTLHIQRFRITGSPCLKERKSTEERFLSKIDKTDACWIWKGPMGMGGYGKFCFTEDGVRKQIISSRYSYEYFVGKIPDNLFVCHRCDRRDCVSPDHLFLGTHTNNMRDMHSKGRGKKYIEGTAPKGEKCGASKLKQHEVFEIKKLIAQGLKDVIIAHKFNVARRTIGFIRNGITWRHLDE